MSVKDEVLFLLRDRDWVYVKDFETLFPAGVEGHQSWPQRLRELRKEGYRIIKRRKANCKHTFEYKLETESRTPHEELTARVHLAEETRVNYKECGKQLAFI
jgi:hypothetical protein